MKNRVNIVEQLLPRSRTTITHLLSRPTPCGRRHKTVLSRLEALTRAQTLAALTLLRFSSVRTISRLVLFPSRVAVKSRSSARGETAPPTFVLRVVPPTTTRTTIWARRVFWWPRKIQLLLLGPTPTRPWLRHYRRTLPNVSLETGISSLPCFPFRISTNPLLLKTRSTPRPISLAICNL